MDAPPVAPLEADFVVEQEPIMAHSSLPSVEEAQTNAMLSGNGYNKYDGSHKRRRYMLVFLSILIISLIVGFSVAFGANEKFYKEEASYNNDDDDDDAPIEPEDASVTARPREPSRFRQVVDYLKVRISSEDALLNDKNSPQHLAALWIADQDAANVPLPESTNSYNESFEFVQRYVMAVFYFALNGKNWPRKFHFLSEKSVCDWHLGSSSSSGRSSSSGVRDTMNWKMGVQCDEDGAVSTIFMTDNELEGTLPVELGDLLDLEHLSLFYNDVTGTLPERLKALKYLTFLAIEDNDLTGSIPTWIYQLTNLEYLALGDNDLTGSIPEICAENSKLKELSLEYNILTGSLDNLDDCISLEGMFLSNNFFNYRIHSSTFEDIYNLKVVDIADNKLNGYIPAHFYNYESIDLHSNSIDEWQLEDVAVTDSPLRFFSVYNNSMPGTIPTTFGRLVNLEHLDLSDNALTGDIPSVFTTMTELRSLYLSNNPFDEGDIPDISYCENLQELSLAHTNRVGRLHSVVADYATQLVLIDLHDNSLTGSIPTNIGDLENLAVFKVNRNIMTGDIPAELAQLSNVGTFVWNRGWLAVRSSILFPRLH
jgi:Leucine-rich repeat (LRR) protein